MHDIKFKCADNETRQLDETIYYGICGNEIRFLF